jgi:hypothetical protein
MLTKGKRLVEAQVALARAEAELEHLRATAQLARDAAEESRDSIAKLRWENKMFEERHKESLERYNALNHQAAADRREAADKLRDLELKNAILSERLDLVVNHGIGGPEPTGERKFLSETEEDLEHAVSAGLLNKEELERALMEAGLSNSDITYDFQSSRLP